MRLTKPFYGSLIAPFFTNADLPTPVEPTERADHDPAVPFKALVSSLVSGGGRFTKGWLRWALKGISYALKNDNIRFNGIACRNVIAASRKSHIQMTLY